jgi:hypothetical protein
MNKILLTLTLAFAFIGAHAQCTPDPQYTINDVGIWPDSMEGMPISYVGSNYNEFITIVTPSDTLVDGADFGFPFLGIFTATIDDVEITNVIGLPPNFDFACDPISCAFPGGEIKCGELYSTSNPTASDIGVYNIVIATEIHTSNIPVLSTYTINDTIDYYTITISGVSAVFDKLDNQTFELRDVFPNPVNSQSKIQFISGEPKDIIFSVFNYLGEKMDEQIIAANRGVNDIFINANNYPNGMYLYSINNGEKIISKRMVIAN